MGSCGSPFVRSAVTIFPLVFHVIAAVVLSYAIKERSASKACD